MGVEEGMRIGSRRVMDMFSRITARCERLSADAGVHSGE